MNIQAAILIALLCNTAVDFASGADVLVMHMAVPENIIGVGRKLHAPPSLIGKIAAKTGAGTLVLSHLMVRSLENKGRKSEADSILV